MNILVTGGSGFVGWQVVCSLAADNQVDVAYSYHSNSVQHTNATALRVNLCDVDSVNRVISSVNPDVVIHTAAMTDVDECERSPTLARRVNTEGTKHVVDACERNDASLVFVSTSFVFDGSRAEYRPDDHRDPINEYGHTKADAERYVEASNVSSAIVRTDQPYGKPTEWQSPTMVQWILQNVANGGPLPVFTDWYNQPTFLPDLRDAIIEIALTGKFETYHAVGPDYLSRYEWANIICDVFDYPVDRIVPSECLKADLPATRPNVRLDRAQTESELNSTFLSVKSGLIEIRRVS
ncbi:SDR family oxidoreductase [Natronomonas sp. EA1]|uniref:SDR family oxidoreductase n=1 Tax=Natronomonas sp. EA1 TaxID=3421655 RepID=UPI003EBFEEED